ncbi:hypothetical protein BX611_2299 [Lutibacter oceani]|uniref:Uncharacterized protein n=1 Tax=Lutibacter oceani TaxID=1853311 RepID=A0A3D9RL93_9FLAO|nr:hypothetical protein [Lutibacter oceani]REE80650.1 hypothetical protein BX611_2299 [Lutibacter oceani]
MNQYKEQSFFSLALRFGLIMIVIVSVLEIGFSILKNLSFSIMIEHVFSDGKWKFFIKKLVGLSVIYGVFMAGYYKFIKK